MITLHRVKKAFGSKVNAAQAIGISRPALDKWIADKCIPEIARTVPHMGTNWHDKIRELGFNPIDLSRL